MTKFELIDSVRDLNPTAGVEFLTQFNEEQLEMYLQQLLEVEGRDYRIHKADATLN
jgi:ABC-type transporter MlaC component